MHGRVNREERHLEWAGRPHLERLHALVLFPRLARARPRRAEVQQKAHGGGEESPKCTQEGNEERPREGGRGGRGEGVALVGSGGGGVTEEARGPFDEGGVRRGDGLGGEVEIVGAGAGEEVEGVENGSRDEEEGCWRCLD